MVSEQPSAEMSLDQIEGESWGAAPPDATTLMSTVYSLRRKPIGALAAEDLRVMLAQQVGVDTLVPVALARLASDPLLEGDYYPGDVLVAVLGVPGQYWAEHPEQLARLDAVLASVTEPDRELAADIEKFRERISAVRDG